MIIDDDPELLQLVELVFSRAGAQVYTAASGSKGLRQFYAHQPDLVLLDVIMPKMDGWEVCRHIHQLSDVPLIMLTALSQDDQTIPGLACGADDYVTKPFNSKVLLARVRAVMRRAMQPHPAKKPITYSDSYLMVDLDKHLVSVRGQAVKLSATEHRLLACLLQNAGRLLTYQQILKNVWGEGFWNNSEYIHTYIWYLRQKLEKDPHNPNYLLTEHGLGYRFKKRASN